MDDGSFQDTPHTSNLSSAREGSYDALVDMAGTSAKSNNIGSLEPK
jgi:hypothetical protein